jgi:hypothetical protein
MRDIITDRRCFGVQNSRTRTGATVPQPLTFAEGRFLVGEHRSGMVVVNALSVVLAVRAWMEAL